MRQIIGWSLLVVFFAGLFVGMARLAGWKVAGVVYASAAFITGFLALALWLIQGHM